jgi:GWxTD domain-containing protein
VELYYAVYQKFLKYSPNSSGFSGDAKLEVIIYPKNTEKPLAANNYKINSQISDTTSENIKNKLIGQINYEIKYGEYKFVIIASDFNNPSVVDSIIFDLPVEEFSGGVKMSDIELSTSIAKSTDKSGDFYKNTLEVVPNAGGLYGKNINELYYYAELYNLNSSNISDEFIVRSRILTSNNEELYVSDKKVKRGVESKVEFGMIKVDTLKTAPYIFELSVIDAAKNVNISKTKKFFTYTKSDDKVSSDKGEDYLKSEFAVTTEKDLDDMFEKTLYIRTNTETENYKSLRTLDDKRKFMFNFWKLRDSDLSTPQNEYMKSYFKRMGEANKLFKEDYKDGWKTDRGRIYLQYGVPNDVDFFPFESDTKSYIIWRFNSLPGQGPTEAIFIEKETGTGVYRLVSSTIRGEFRDDNWRELLKQFR